MNFLPADGGRPGADRASGADPGLATGTACREGADVVLAIRPEDVRVAERAGPMRPTSEGNGIAARVEAIEFLGSFFRVDLAAEAARASHGSAPTSRWNLVRGCEADPGPGAVAVSLPRRRMRVYPQGDSTAADAAAVAVPRRRSAGLPASARRLGRDEWLMRPDSR